MSFRDTNMTLVLTDGTEVDIIYPDRLGREYETPWLNTSDRDPEDRREGCREWNIDIDESLASSNRYSPRFIIGIWGTRYGSKDGVKHVIPYTKIKRWYELTPQKQAEADENYRKIKEKEEHDAYMNPNRLIRFGEYKELLARVDRLEGRLTQAWG